MVKIASIEFLVSRLKAKVKDGRVQSFALVFGSARKCQTEI